VSECGDLGKEERFESRVKGMRVWGMEVKDGKRREKRERLMSLTFSLCFVESSMRI